MRLPALTFSFPALVLLAALAGCATPQYQTTVRLIPPADAQGRACVADCEAKKNACQADCQARYQACVKDIEPQVEARYAEALKQYELELRQYAAALRRYEMELHFEWLRSYPYS
jgi:alpha/beta superfamily hydrolase